MKIAGWIIIIGELVGSMTSLWRGFTLPSAIMNAALILAGAALLCVDRITKKEGK